jgi:hypothetical protein
MRFDIHAPVTQQPATIEAAEEAATARAAGKRRLAKNGYITYLRHPELHTNSAYSSAGFGWTPEESYAAAHYWANQAAWVVTVRFDCAPQWARDEAAENER